MLQFRLGLKLSETSDNLVG